MPLPQKFKAMVVSETAEKTFAREIRERPLSDLPAGELIIEVKYSSLNYKDALSATGNKGVTRKYPHTPGIDAAGIIADSTTKLFGVGDQVTVTGFDLGMNTSGGFGQYISVPALWATKLPQGLSLQQSMSYGTAGLTAALCIIRLMASGLTKDSGEVLVTGATGGLGGVVVRTFAEAGARLGLVGTDRDRLVAAASAAGFPVYPWSTQAFSTEFFVAIWVFSDSSSTCARSCSSAGLTVRATGLPMVSTAVCTLLPFVRL